MNENEQLHERSTQAPPMIHLPRRKYNGGSFCSRRREKGPSRGSNESSKGYLSSSCTSSVLEGRCEGGESKGGFQSPIFVPGKQPLRSFCSRWLKGVFVGLALDRSSMRRRRRSIMAAGSLFFWPVVNRGERRRATL
ncbi:unnamed protein product [Lactuca saligna]|uniref:Uncharacterized protein n=1 Tax=Lactuca saligna TaxID=75948 RepID=A0AA35ZNJ2_LACSI|nr:unnamed protein product [Lactuca saligna]